MRKVKKSNCRYFHSCVGFPEKYLDDLTYMIENSKEVQWESFIVNVDRDQIKDLFPHYHWGSHNPEGWGMRIKDDWAVGFYKSTFRGYNCYYIRHSAIEYIWIQTDFIRSAYSKRRWPEPIDNFLTEENDG